MYYDDIVSASLVFLKCETFTSNSAQNDGTLADLPRQAGVDISVISSGQYNNGYSFVSNSGIAPTVGGLSVADGSIGSGDNFSYGGWFHRNGKTAGTQFAITLFQDLNYAHGSYISPYADSECVVNYNNTTISYGTGNGYPADNDWHWYCVERSGTALNLYIDNINTPVSGVVVGNLAGDITSLNVGNFVWFSSNNFNPYFGLMDDVFVYPGVLTGEDKNNLKNATSAPAVVSSSASTQGKSSLKAAKKAAWNPNE